MQPKIDKPLKITQEYVDVNIYKLLKKIILISNSIITSDRKIAQIKWLKTHRSHIDVIGITNLYKRLT